MTKNLIFTVLISLSFTAFLPSSSAQVAIIGEPGNFSTGAAPIVGQDGKLYVLAATPRYADGALKIYNAMVTSDLQSWEMKDSMFYLSEIDWGNRALYSNSVVFHNNKYVMFYQALTKDKPGRFVGVAQSDSPLGPYENISKDEPLARMSNPCAFKDDDGSIYLYSHDIVLPIGDDLKTKGEETTLQFLGKDCNHNSNDGVYLFKRNGIYYWLCGESEKQITYWTGDSPMGPFTYKGMLMVPNKTGSSEVAVVEYKDNYIIFYDIGKRNSGGNPIMTKRVCADYLHFNDDGSIKLVFPTQTGLATQ